MADKIRWRFYPSDGHFACRWPIQKTSRCAGTLFFGICTDSLPCVGGGGDFIALCELPLPQLQSLDKALYEPLRQIYREFRLEDAERIKEIESVTTNMSKRLNTSLKRNLIFWACKHLKNSSTLALLRRTSTIPLCLIRCAMPCTRCTILCSKR